MQLLYWFESIRTPFLDTAMSLVTRLGEDLLIEGEVEDRVHRDR